MIWGICIVLLLAPVLTGKSTYVSYLKYYICWFWKYIMRITLHVNVCVYSTVQVFGNQVKKMFNAINLGSKYIFALTEFNIRI